MTSRDFCYWLQGYFEIARHGSLMDSKVTLDRGQVALVQRHLSMVFAHEIDPLMGDKGHQDELSKIHGGGSAVPPGFSKPPRARC